MTTNHNYRKFYAKLLKKLKDNCRKKIFLYEIAQKTLKN